MLKEEGISKDSTFEAIKYYLSNGGFVQTDGGTRLEDGTEVVLNVEEEGIFQAHEYSVLGFLEMDGFRLIKLRNPHGKGEWNGDWSDNSDLWEQYPEIKMACKHKKSDDGFFWMSLDDFYVRMGSPKLTAMGFEHLPNLFQVKGGNWVLDTMYKDYRDDLEELTEIRYKINQDNPFKEGDLSGFPQYTFEIEETMEFLAVTQHVYSGAGGFLYVYIFPEDAENTDGRITDFNLIENREYIAGINDEDFIEFELEPGTYKMVFYGDGGGEEGFNLQIWSTDKLELEEITD